MFIFLELLSFWLIVTRNSYHKAIFTSSANNIVGFLYKTRNDIAFFVNLQEENDELRIENSRLLSFTNYLDSINADIDTTMFEYVTAEVVNNSILKPDNFLTISKGSKNGIKEGMGVISSNGIVGKIKVCSKNFSTLYSLLHSEVSIASQFKSSKSLCTTKWSHEYGYTKAAIQHVAPHIKVAIGDTVVTSGNNSIFPEGVNIGVVQSVSFKENENFQEILIDLTTDFSKLNYVYIVDYSLKTEKDSLEALSGYN